MESFTKEYLIKYIKRQLTGSILKLEIKDEIIGDYIEDALMELRRYYDGTVFVTVPFAPLIDLTDFKHSAVVNVYRAEGYLGDTIKGRGEGFVDPAYVQQWMVFNQGGGSYNLQNYVYNFLSFSTLMQMRNTTSTELDFQENRATNKLFINGSYDAPKAITIEYIPILEKPEDVIGEYWQDILKKLALGLVKEALGRIRTRFTLSNALWTQDGENMLQAASEELKDLREKLENNSMLFIPKD